MAQERKERNRLNSTRNQKRKYLLSGRLTCICGARMQGESKKRRAGGYNVYYRCQNHRYAHIVGECPVNYVRTDLIEPKSLGMANRLAYQPNKRGRRPSKYVRRVGHSSYSASRRVRDRGGKI